MFKSPSLYPKSPAFIPFGANDDELEKRKIREERQAAQRRLTLEDNLDQINVKKLERAIVTDPLFTKTSGQFDEGGASGLLLYNLPVFNGCEIMFDSEAIIVNPSRTQPEEQGKDYVDISFAFREVELLLSADDPESWEITPSISALYELADDHRWKAAVGASAKDSSHDMDGNAVRSAEGFKAFDAGDEPVGGVGGRFPFGDDNDDGSVVDFGGGGDDGWNDDGCGFAGPPFAGADAPGMIPAGDSDGENGYSDVDDGMDAADWLAAGMGMTRLKGSNAWAGPKHWHFVKSKEEAPAAAPEAKGRKKRAAKSELIDFSDPQIDESLFQAPKALKEIQLTKAGRKVVNTLLPKDYHYDGRKLATAFISSNWNFLARKARGRGGEKQGFGDGGGGDGFAAVGGSEDVFEDAWGGDECADPFDYGDDFDGQGDSAEVKPADDFMEDLVPMPKKAQKIDVNYARQSKQVDVKILKDTIWVELQRRHAHEREEQQDDDEFSSGPISFDRVLHNFPANCRAAALSDISVHLCFISAARSAPELPARSSPWGIFSLFSSPASPPTPLSGGAPPGSSSTAAPPRPPLLYRMRGAFSFLLALNLVLGGAFSFLLALNLVLGGVTVTGDGAGGGAGEESGVPGMAYTGGQVSKIDLDGQLEVLKWILEAKRREQVGASREEGKRIDEQKRSLPLPHVTFTHEEEGGTSGCRPSSSCIARCYTAHQTKRQAHLVPPPSSSCEVPPHAHQDVIQHVGPSVRNTWSLPPPHVKFLRTPIRMLYSTSDQASGTPGRHQWLQSRPFRNRWASGRIALM
ncbi:unnamed protein product [Closterium sp. Naga37s-1]|nr:unnamed protein product [Closterium sp. Naga37s-1]